MWETDWDMEFNPSKCRGTGDRIPHGSHMDRVVNSANKTIGFVKRNIKAKMPGVREAAYMYNTLVRSQLEYAAVDPNHKDKIQQIEKVQRLAARCTTCNFDSRASVSNIQSTLVISNPRDSLKYFEISVPRHIRVESEENNKLNNHI